MRALPLAVMALLCGVGCHHSAHSAVPCPPAGAPATVGPGASVVEERCPPVADGTPSCPAPATVTCPQAGESCPQCEGPRCRSLWDRICGTKPEREKCEKGEKCAVQEIRVNVPPPKVVIRKEKVCAREEAPPKARAPGNEVLLVPRVVYVPYAQMNPTGPATMIPLQTSMAPPPVAAPPPCVTPTCEPAPKVTCPAPSGCPTPGVGLDRPRGEAEVVWGPMGGPRAAAPSAGQPGVEDLQRRCADLEAKIDVLVDALNRSRATRADGPK
jgi:hypothetical protein